ncbi:hypothetical protein ACGFNU_13650 [Spirillospora sp. NPDC048911]|uniref:hypothetical protein n=1 Tax=Spirillospora sp. NPDC048911 TaxID=3364527 RepID=UPI003717B4CD
MATTEEELLRRAFEDRRGDAPAPNADRVLQVRGRIRRARRRRAAAGVAGSLALLGVAGAVVLPLTQRDAADRSTAAAAPAFGAGPGRLLASAIITWPRGGTSSMRVRRVDEPLRLRLACNNYQEAFADLNISVEGENTGPYHRMLPCLGGKGQDTEALLPVPRGTTVLLETWATVPDSAMPTPEEAMDGGPRRPRALRLGVFESSGPLSDSSDTVTLETPPSGRDLDPLPTCYPDGDPRCLPG